jgi:SAM-dependent methyltransferase
MRAPLVLFALVFVACRSPATLDTTGKRMLDPIRVEALAVPELIAHLHLDAGATVADVGAGPGFLTLPIARAVARGQVIATDVRSDYLAFLEGRAAEAGLHNIVTRVVSPDDPELERGSIDLALLCQVDHVLGDRARYFRALALALKPKGRIALVNFIRYEAADREAAKSADLSIVADWRPTPPYFMLLLEREG